MLYKELSVLPYCDLRIGMMVYFYENPINYKEELKVIFEEYCNITQEKMLFYRYNTDIGLKRMKKDNISFYNDIINGSTFNSTEHIILTNATEEKMQTVKCEMKLSNYEPIYPIRLPNQMYFEFLPSVDYEKILSFICFVCERIKLHYSCCNPLLGVNDHHPNRSYSYAVKKIQNCVCLTEKYSIYANSTLRRGLEGGIDGPNMVQVLSRDLYSHIGCKELINACKENGLCCDMQLDYIVISVSRDKFPECDEEFEELYKKLNRILVKIKLDLKKPQMYWKPQEWDAWKNRFI